MVYGCRKLPGTGSHLKTIRRQLKTAHPFFLPETESVAKETGFEIRTYDRGEILQFAGDNRFDEAFCFDENHPICWEWQRFQTERSSAWRGQAQIVLCSGRSGINVEKEAECRHIASTLVTILKERDREIGKSAVLWNQYVKSCVTAGSGECRISRGMGGTSGGS